MCCNKNNVLKHCELENNKSKDMIDKIIHGKYNNSWRALNSIAHLMVRAMIDGEVRDDKKIRNKSTTYKINIF